MSALREAAQQALEALEAMQAYAAAERKGLRICDEAITTLRAALAQERTEPKPMRPELRKMWEEHFDRCFRAMPLPAQEQAEPLNLSDRAVQKRLAAQWGYVPAERAEPAQKFKPTPLTQEQMDAPLKAEPAQEPVAVVQWNDIGHISWRALVMLPDGTPLYTAPPRRTMVPLTEEDLGKLYADWYKTPAAGLAHFARAVEKAIWEKNHG